MKAWARRVLTADYSNSKTWAYMDKVGIMHTGESPFKHQRTMGIAPLNVPCMCSVCPLLPRVHLIEGLTCCLLDRDCALTLGLVQTVIQTAILGLPDDVASIFEKTESISAVTKVGQIV